MADVNNCPEPTFPTKRISDLTSDNSAIDAKKQKLETPDTIVKDSPESLKPIQENDVVQKGKNIEEQPNPEPEPEEVEEDKGSNGKAVIDRKGKGILIEEGDDEEDEDDSDDDSDDSGYDEFGDELSDASDHDDPLAEVDLDNILPSRTRRKIINPGAYLATDLPPEDSDDSDDPDA